MKRQWYFDKKALKFAENKFHLKKPVHYRAVRDRPLYDGTYEYDILNDSHKILIDQNLDPIEANRCIWHELTHAMQCERDYSGREWKFNIQNLEDLIQSECWTNSIPPYPTARLGDDGYDDWYKRYMSIPTEAEAFKSERYLAWRYSLIKET